MNDGVKRCAKCGNDYPRSEFHANRSSKDGLFSYCKPCSRTAARAWQLTHLDRSLQTSREYKKNHKDSVLKKTTEYRKAHPWLVRKWRRSWYQRHPDYRRNQTASRRQKNPDLWSEYQKRYARSHKDEINSKTRRYRSRKRGAVGFHTASDVREIRKLQDNKCFWCGIDVGCDGEIDHVIPLARGGSNDRGNLVLSCSRCNKTKGNRLPQEWRRHVRISQGKV